MVHTRIKICGITRPEDARIVARSGADAIGLVFYPRSPRAVTVEQAADILAGLPPFLTTVALFVDETAEEIHRVLQAVAIDLIQFHGEETPEFCGQFNRPWMKALRVRPGVDIQAFCQRYAAASAILLDAWEEGVPGGTGRQFDWQLAPRTLDRPCVLAGGLNQDNVGDAINQLCPYAVDVSGGVESSPGIKDARKIMGFVAAVRAAEKEVEQRTYDK